MNKDARRTCPRLDPEEEICPEFDSTGVRLFPIPYAEGMGFRVTDNFPEEHIQ